MGKHTRFPPKFKKAAQDNPWGLTPMECYIMALACQLGGAKPVYAETDIPFRIAQDHIQSSRARMGMRSHDCRVFIYFHDWFKEYAATNNIKILALIKRHPPIVRPQSDGKPAAPLAPAEYEPTTTWRKGSPYQSPPRSRSAG